MRQVKEAQNYDVVSFARAMNDDFGGRVQKLFEPEKEAALEAQETGTVLLSKKKSPYHELYLPTLSDRKRNEFEFLL